MIWGCVQIGQDGWFLTPPGATCAATTKSSATLEVVGVRDIGRKGLLMSLAGFCLVRGTMSASFQDDGNCCSAKLLLRREVMGRERMSPYSLSTQLGTPSGPEAFRGFSLLSATETSFSDRMSTSEFASKGGIACKGVKAFVVSKNAELIALANSRAGRCSRPSTRRTESDVGNMPAIRLTAPPPLGGA